MQNSNQIFSKPSNGGGEGAFQKSRPYPELKSPLTKPKIQNQEHITGIRESRQWTHPKTPIPFYRLTKLVNRIGELEKIIGDKPEDWRKPNYGNLDYAIAHQMGWITDEQEKFDRIKYEQRRERSLRNCFTPNPLRYGKFKEWTFDFENETHHIERQAPIETGAYIPEMPATILRDYDLTDGAKIALAKILEETYRNNRDQRWLATTISYLENALGKCKRTIQNYLRLLEKCGYIQCDVMTSNKTCMSVGLYIKLNDTAFAKHHKKSWPLKNWHTPMMEDHLNGVFDGNSGVQKDSSNYFTAIYIKGNVKRMPVTLWAVKSMMKIFQRFMENNEPYTPPELQF